MTSFQEVVTVCAVVFLLLAGAFTVVWGWHVLYKRRSLYGEMKTEYDQQIGRVEEKVKGRS